MTIASGTADDDDILFRYYSLAYLMLDACFYDLKALVRTVRTSARLPADADKLVGFINNVWKHRSGDQGDRPAFHRTHHHGPYLFADCPGFENDLPEDAAYLSVDHDPADVTGVVTLVVPGLVKAVAALGEAVDAVEQLLTDDRARAVIKNSFGEPV